MKEENNELDQIVKFDFKNSVFDVIVFASVKTMLLFILISELEAATICVLEAENPSVQNSLNTSSTDYKLAKRILHFLVSFVCVCASVYLAVKFSLVLSEIVQKQNKMSYFFFSVLVTEFGFSLVQLLLATLGWSSMRKLSLEIQAQRLRDEIDDAEPTKKGTNIRRLIGLSYPERFIIFLGFLMLIVSSVTTVIVPFFFGSVVDAALNYPDLTEMNKYVIIMFLVFFGGSIAGGIRSWLFEVAGQRVVARLRRQVFAAIIRQDIEFFDTNRTGELTSRISSDTQVLQNTVTSNLSMLARYLIQIIGSVIFMFSLEPSLSGQYNSILTLSTLRLKYLQLFQFL